MNVWSVILAAGKGVRLAGELAVQGAPRKQFLSWNGLPLFWHSVIAFSRVPRLQGIVLVFPEDEVERGLESALECAKRKDPGVPWKAVPGGLRRQDSVRRGVAALPPACTHLLIHDAARPFVSTGTIHTVIQAMLDGADAVIPTVGVTDTIKIVREGTAVETLPRDALVAAQTPQGFRLDLLLRAQARAEEEDWEVTDDASMVERYGSAVSIVQGEEDNVKITTPRDLRLLAVQTPPAPCVGWGYDVHRYGPGRPMVLGGIPIANGPEIVAHSDGDVLLHALADGLLGCLGLGDIGEHFPDTDPSIEGISSAVLLARVLDMAKRVRLTVTHVDLTIIAEIPRLAPYREQIRKNVAALLGLAPARVNLKATTEEGLGFTGEKKGIKAVAAVTALLDTTTGPVQEEERG
jgi:2-C-methyl-D-erythritol 4-phosphate cytidylyltransferase / 2-C-methyl-D-erythritol 2,4-cyclodiphosphate synthase